MTAPSFLPLEFRPFWPLMRDRVRKQLAAGAPSALGKELADAVRGELSPAEAGRMAQVLRCAAEELGV